MTIYKKKRRILFVLHSGEVFCCYFFFIKKEQKKMKMLRNSWKCVFYCKRNFYFVAFIFIFCTFFDLNLMPIVFLGGVLFFFEEGHLWRKKNRYTRIPFLKTLTD
jgi:hypothetical protein